MSIVDNDNNYIMAIVCMEMEVWLDYWCSDSQASWLSIWIYTISWVHNMYPLYTYGYALYCVDSNDDRGIRE